MADTGFKSPSAEGLIHNDFQNGNRMFSSNDSYATELTIGEKNDIYNFSFDIPQNILITILGIEVTVEAVASANTDNTKVSLSWNSGVSETSTKQVSHDTSETTETVGGSTDIWGRFWKIAEFDDGKFTVILEKLSAGTTSYDHIQVKVYYQQTVGGIGTKELRTDWPFEEGLTARTQSQVGRQSRLEAEGLEGIKTTVLSKDKALL